MASPPPPAFALAALPTSSAPSSAFFAPPLTTSRPTSRPHSATRHTIRAVHPPNKAPPPASSTASKAIAAFAAASILLSAPSLPPAAHAPFVAPPFVAPAHAARGAKGGGASFLSASGDVNKDPESLLRWSLPISNKPVRELQTELEAAVTDLRGLKWAKVDNHVKAASRLLNNQTNKILVAVPAAARDDASAVLASAADRLHDVEAAVTDKSTDKLTKACKDVLGDIGRVEEMMVAKFPFQVPDEFSNLPQLKGRATVEMLVKKDGDEPFDIEGTIFKEGKMTLVLDGYSAPISAGSFVDLVNKGFYNDNPVFRSDGFIIQAGKPKNGEGFTDATGKVRSIPLEIFARGDKEPTYGITLEEDGRGAQGTVLPFTSYGTLAMARAETEANTASSQFFWFLFEPDLTPAGRNLMDGNWAVFGYTTKGENFLKGLQKGDRIVEAKVVDGLQNLVTAK
ncbi:unnamed protein product [Chondrus crispus]|uniref:peptidylprolyl isomerase n=1 Tax=Chondrus crispus TaxID=2769 RepID=R7QPR7_CHOCR|nr:unnamed protein product [Chondrus crispus]CDF39778.1 unnamed protein product [Chondrus crispus]|eukprot:XP_005710072.1 unnamed protein product [Chondrus crispus]